MSKRVVSVVLAALLVFSLALSITGCGSNNPKGVVNTYFEAVDEHDAAKFLKCFEKDVVEDIEDELEEDEIEDLLKMMDEYYKQQYGSKWAKDYKVTDTEKGDTDDGVTEYTVTVEFEDDDEDIDVLRIKGKYYIDDNSLGSFGL